MSGRGKITDSCSDFQKVFFLRCVSTGFVFQGSCDRFPSTPQARGVGGAGWRGCCNLAPESWDQLLGGSHVTHPEDKCTARPGSAVTRSPPSAPSPDVGASPEPAPSSPHRAAQRRPHGASAAPQASTGRRGGRRGDLPADRRDSLEARSQSRGSLGLGSKQGLGSHHLYPCVWRDER